MIRGVKMSWIIYGLLASLFWGSYIVVSKVASSDDYFGLDPFLVSLFMLVGIFIVFAGSSFFFREKLTIPESKLGIGFAILAGALWAVGMIASLLAVRAGADVSKLVPLYNSNTLIAVLLGIVFLHEVPSTGGLVRVIIGSVLIVVGATVVSL